jgi:AcrR family transcriptional regulator
MNVDPTLRAKPRGAATLQPERTRAIWRAAIIELARVGYQRLSMESIARRAGVGKAALYRRWDGKEAMIIALVAAIDFEIVRGADKGSLLADIRDYLEGAFRLLRRPLAFRILPEFYSEMGRDTELATAIRNTVLEQKRASIRQLIDRAVARGELSNPVRDDLTFDLIVGPIYWHTVIARSSTDEEYLQSAAAAMTAALRAAYTPIH